MDLFEAFEKRHSYRGNFLDKPVLREDLIRILNAGLMAPSGKNQQTTEFVIIDDKKLIEKIACLKGANKAVQQAKAFIICIIDKEAEAIYEGFSFQIEDCSAAVENMLLAITALEYASVWIDGWLRVDKRAEKIADLIGLGKNKKIQVILPIGVPAEQKSQPGKKAFEERVYFNRYGK